MIIHKLIARQLSKEVYFSSCIKLITDTIIMRGFVSHSPSSPMSLEFLEDEKKGERKEGLVILMGG